MDTLWIKYLIWAIWHTLGKNIYDVTKYHVTRQIAKHYYEHKRFKLGVSLFYFYYIATHRGKIITDSK